MTSVIRSEFRGTDDWLDRLPQHRRHKLQNELAKARANDALVDTLLFTQFADKANIICMNKRWKIRKEKFDREFARIHSLRNHLAHANDYAASPGAAAETCRTVRLIDEWIDHLTLLLP
jgi:hypothetical protein